MAYTYSDVVNVADVEQIVGTNYTNEARLVQYGLVRTEGDPVMQGVNIGWVREKLFEDSDSGQAIGIDTEVTLKKKVQTKYQTPIVSRGDAAEFDDTFEEISAKVKKDAMTTIASAITRKNAQMLDKTLLSVLEGVGAYVITDTTNYLDTSTNQISLAYIASAKAKRYDDAFTNGGTMLVRSLVYHKLVALGLIAATTNTFGNAAQDSMVRTGKLGTVCGLNVEMSDKLALNSSDYLCYLLEPTSIIVYGATAPQIDPIQRKERGFKDILKWKFRAGVGFEGMSWGATASDLVLDTDLATGTNWTLAKANIKHLPIVVLDVPLPA